MAVALQRELEAYQGAIEDYVKDARRYKSAAATHNAAVDAYRASFIPNNGEIAVFRGHRGGYHVPNTNIRLNNAQANQYAQVNFGGGQFGFRYKDKLVPEPGTFTMEQPTSPGPAPSVTTAQVKKLSQPSLTDIERTGGSGLISSAFNY
jgi:hypothetical protein